MRQLQVLVDEGEAARVMALAEEHDAFDPRAAKVADADGRRQRMVMLTLPNDRVGAFVRRVADEVDDARFVLLPRGVLPVGTPLDRVADRISTVASLSSMELVLAALQSIGSWPSLLGYAAMSGIIAAYALVLGASYLLVAAMLIAPLGAPVMVAVIGAAIGDARMIGRGALRFVAGVAILVVSAAVVGYLYGLDGATGLMGQVSSISLGSGAIAVVAGAAGAESQVQSDRASLVTATATGFLVAAALSPTSGVLGLGLMLGRWDLVQVMAFQLLVQFVGLLAGGWGVLALHRIGPGDTTTGRGSRGIRLAAPALAFAAVVALTAWQASAGPRFRHADDALRVDEAVSASVRSIPGVRLVSLSAEFTSAEVVRGEEAVLFDVVVQRLDASADDAAVEARVREAVSARTRIVGPRLRPFVRVSVLPPPAAP